MIDVMAGIARAKDVSVAQIALAWLLHQRVVTSVATAVRLTDRMIGRADGDGWRRAR